MKVVVHRIQFIISEEFRHVLYSAKPIYLITEEILDSNVFYQIFY